jgi:hypothetical protein
MNYRQVNYLKRVQALEEKVGDLYGRQIVDPLVPHVVLGMWYSYHCLRCGHVWGKIIRYKSPRDCPKCHSVFWDVPVGRRAETIEEVRTIRRRVKKLLKIKEEGS